jgi:hypothetical protein
LQSGDKRAAGGTDIEQGFKVGPEIEPGQPGVHIVPRHRRRNGSRNKYQHHKFAALHGNNIQRGCSEGFLGCQCLFTPIAAVNIASQRDMHEMTW